MKAFLWFVLGLVYGLVTAVLTAVGLLGAFTFYLSMQNKEEDKKESRYPFRSFYGDRGRVRYTPSGKVEESEEKSS